MIFDLLGEHDVRNGHLDDTDVSIVNTHGKNTNIRVNVNQ